MTHKKSYDLTVSTQLDLEEARPNKRTTCFLGQRHVAALVGFLHCFLQNAYRMALSVSIVAMVKHGQFKETSNRNESEASCPLPSDPSKLVVGSNYQGEFDWSTELQGWIIGAGFLSYLITQAPAGAMADALGAKNLLVFSNGLSGILTLISPFTARWNVYALIAVQLLRGASQGCGTPAVYRLISSWIPRNERGTLSTLVVTGYSIGIGVSGMVVGWLCDIPGLGWPSAFYFWGGFSVLVSITFYFIFYETPENHPWITDEELNYITEGLEVKASKQQPPTPWKKIFSSIATHAYFYGLFGHYWSICYFISVHPSFMGTVLHYPMTENGVTSCLPVLTKSIGGIFASIASYWIAKKDLIGLNKLRKMTTVIGALGFSFSMVGILLAGCDAFVNILCFTLSLFSSGIALSGIMIAGVDMAPTFAGSLMGVASTIASLSSVLPVITGYVTTHETLSEWRIIFWINVCVVGSSGLVYGVFGSADIQPWNYPENEETADVATVERKEVAGILGEKSDEKEKL